jgi:hypothetical protein
LLVKCSLSQRMREIVEQKKIILKSGVGWRKMDSPYWELAKALELPSNASSAHRLYVIAKRHIFPSVTDEW